MLADSGGSRDPAGTVRALAPLHGSRRGEGEKDQRDGERPQRRSSDDSGRRGEAATVRHDIANHGTNACPEYKPHPVLRQCTPHTNHRHSQHHHCRDHDRSRATVTPLSAAGPPATRWFVSRR